MNDNLIRSSRSFFPMMQDSLFNNMIRDFFDKPAVWAGKEKISYPMNIIKIKKNNEIIAYRIEYALAGFKKEEIKVSLSGDILKVEATHNDTETTNDYEEMEYNGISYRNMSLSYKLMDDADKKNIGSKFTNGLLSVTIPIKTVSDESKTIEIDEQ